MAGTASPRPLRGQSFYLDLPSGRGARALAEAIGRLGGVTESFLSKEVTYVVSSNKEAKRGQARSWEEKQRNPTSEGTKSTSSVPAASKGNPPRPRQKPPDTALLSRGKELLYKAMKNQDSCSGSSILANARLWGVQILHVDEMLSYAQQLLRAVTGARKRCQKPEVKCPTSRSKIHKGKLKPPFLKVEDQSRQFRPFHHQFQSFPDLNFLAPKSSSPFEPLKSLSNSCQARGAEGSALPSAGGKSPRSTPVTVPRRRRGFCECCQETFEELQKHLQSPQHQQFAQDDSQYVPVDCVISQLTHSFVECSARVPWSSLADEHAVPQTHGTEGTELLPAELGKEGEQPEQDGVELVMDTEWDDGLKPKGCSPCVPRDSNPGGGGGGGLSEHGSLGLPGGAGLSRGVCAAHGTTGKAGLGASRLALAPELDCAAPCPVGEAIAPPTQPGSVRHPPQALPAPRKRRLCSRQSSQAGKRPRLELGGGLSPLGERTEPVGAGVGTRGAGQVAEAGLPLSTGPSNRAPSSLALDLCLAASPGDPGSPGAVGFDPGEAAAASTASKRGWSRESSPGKQLGGESDNEAGKGSRPGLESSASSTSCPAGRLPSPLAAATCSCSLCLRAAAGAAPGARDIPGQGPGRAPSPGLLLVRPPSPGAAPGSTRSSSESAWAVHRALQEPQGRDRSGSQAEHRALQEPQGRDSSSGSRAVHRALQEPQGRDSSSGSQAVHRALQEPQGRDRSGSQAVHRALQEPQGRDSSSGSQAVHRALQEPQGRDRSGSRAVHRALQEPQGRDRSGSQAVHRESELAWAGPEDRSCRNCCTETRGASFPVFGTLFGSWTS